MCAFNVFIPNFSATPVVKDKELFLWIGTVGESVFVSRGQDPRHRSTVVSSWNERSPNTFSLEDKFGVLKHEFTKENNGWTYTRYVGNRFSFSAPIDHNQHLFWFLDFLLGQAEAQQEKLVH